MNSPRFFFVLLLSLLQLTASRTANFRSRSLLQEVSKTSLPEKKLPLSEDDGNAYMGGEEKETGIVDNPDPGYEKVKVDETPCDDGLGPDPNILEPKNEKDDEESSPEFNPETKLERIVRTAVKKFSKYDMDNGNLWLKSKKDRIPLCPGAKKRAPIPGVDCTLTEPEQVVPPCCGCGCGCCKQNLRAVINNVVNRHLHIDMETGRPFKNLPLCRELKQKMVQDVRKEQDVPLKTLLLRKIKEGDKKKRKR